MSVALGVVPSSSPCSSLAFLLPIWVSPWLTLSCVHSVWAVGYPCVAPVTLWCAFPCVCVCVHISAYVHVFVWADSKPRASVWPCVAVGGWLCMAGLGAVHGCVAYGGVGLLAVYAV